jgi:hypothetical protein
MPAGSLSCGLPTIQELASLDPASSIGVIHSSKYGNEEVFTAFIQHYLDRHSPGVVRSVEQCERAG